MHRIVAEESRPLAEFAAQPDAVLRELRASGRPLTLTVDGQPSVVVQDASAFGELLDRLERLETIAALRESFAQDAAGQTVPFDEAMDEIARKYDLPALEDA